jgi:HEAT repeat protein
MTRIVKLEQLLSRVEYRAEYDAVEGINEFRTLLETDPKGEVHRFLSRAFTKLEGKVQGGIAFVLAEHYRKNGMIANFQDLFASGDENVRESVLNALWGEPGESPEMGRAIVEMAIAAATDPSPGVRTEVAYVLQNQSGWGVDVAAGIDALPSLLKDADARVKQQAAYAVGNLAKRKYDLSNCIAQLRRNVKNKDVHVRESSAWALWQLSRYKHDIAAAVPELVWLCSDKEDYDKPRKNAAGALLHHCKKSSQNCKAVRARVNETTLDTGRKEIRKFLSDIETIK